MRWVGSIGGTCDQLAEMIDYAQRLEELRKIISSYGDRLERVQRLYLSESSAALAVMPDLDFKIRRATADFFEIPFRKVAFAGSAQLGISVHKGRSFSQGESDLDIACIDTALFHKAWMDVIKVTRAFTSEESFVGGEDVIREFKDALLRRAMIRVRNMPKSELSHGWRSFEKRLTLEHSSVFKSVSVAIYASEYAFCWKQDSALSAIRRIG